MSISLPTHAYLTLPQRLLNLMKEQPQTYTRPIVTTVAEAADWLRFHGWSVDLTPRIETAGRLLFARWRADGRRLRDENRGQPR